MLVMWKAQPSPTASVQSLADIKRIAELEEEAITSMKQHHDPCWKIEELEKTLSHCKVFLEEMHYLEVNETIKNSSVLHSEVSKALKETK